MLLGGSTTSSEARAWPLPEARRRRPAAEAVAALVLLLAAGAAIAALAGLSGRASAPVWGEAPGRRRLDDGAVVVNVTHEEVLDSLRAEVETAGSATGTSSGPQVEQSAAEVVAVSATSNLRSSVVVATSPPAPSLVPLVVLGSGCSSGNTECTDSKCCSSQGFRCYQKNNWYAECRTWCTPGIHYTDLPRFQTPWSCSIAGAPVNHHPSVKTPAPTAPAPASPTITPDPSLLLPSSGKVHTFYVYRVQSDQNYAPENQNVANLAGAMWYLHHEIVNNRYERRFGKTRVERFKVSTKAPQPLVDAGMDFGLRYAFDLGQCTGPYDCQQGFAAFGYAVGCNEVGSFPTQQWAGQVFYKDAIWYSFPGKCSSKTYFEETPECKEAEPGGHCTSPTGQKDCTYSYEDAGQITIDELEGIGPSGDFSSLDEFRKVGGWEYNNQTDKGVHMTFWDGISDADACQTRMDKAMKMFDTNRPDMPSSASLSAPRCNFDETAYFAIVPRVDPHREALLNTKETSGK